MGWSSFRNRHCSMPHTEIMSPRTEFWNRTISFGQNLSSNLDRHVSREYQLWHLAFYRLRDDSLKLRMKSQEG
jgi:hypothetical protein